MIPRDETEAINWKPQMVRKPPLPAIIMPREETVKQKPVARELPSRSSFVSEKFISDEGVAFFFPKSEANAFNLAQKFSDCGSKTNMASFEADDDDDDKEAAKFKEVTFKVKTIFTHNGDHLVCLLECLFSQYDTIANNAKSRSKNN